MEQTEDTTLEALIEAARAIHKAMGKTAPFGFEITMVGYRRILGPTVMYPPVRKSIYVGY